MYTCGRVGLELVVYSEINDLFQNWGTYSGVGTPVPK